MAESGDGDGVGAGKHKHIFVFPYPAPGHISPFLNFSRLLISRGLTVTVLLTPSYRHMLDTSDSIHLLVLPVDDTPVTADFPFFTKMRGLRELQNPIVNWFKTQKSPPVAIVSDAFLGWTHHLACQLCIPRLAFYTSGAADSLVSYLLWRDLPVKGSSPPEDDFLVSLPTAPNCPKYPWWQICHLYKDYTEGDPDCDAYRDGMVNNMLAWGIIFNSFSELEGVYIDHLKKLAGHNRVWAVGPLLSPINDEQSLGQDLSVWLDDKPEDSVVYVCFGSYFMLTNQQMSTLASALHHSGVHFIWVINGRIKGHEEAGHGEIPHGFEDLVGRKGFMIRGWAPQVAILRHRAVGAFLTHCGWNSAMEGLMEGVVMLTWPLDGDQFTNARLLVDELGVAVRACEGGTLCEPDSAELARLLLESVTDRQTARDRVREMQTAAWQVVKGSKSNVDAFVEQLNELVM